MSEKKQNAVNNHDGVENNIGSTCFMDIETSGLPITGGFNKYYPFSQTAYYDQVGLLSWLTLLQIRGEKLYRRIQN